jgi:hypothetical protein
MLISRRRELYLVDTVDSDGEIFLVLDGHLTRAKMDKVGHGLFM